MRLVVALAVSTGIAAAAATAESASPDVPRDPYPRSAGVSVSVFAEPPSEVAASGRPVETLRLAGERYGMPTVFLKDGRRSMAPAGGSFGITRGRATLAILSSAVLPGLGELILYADSRDPWTLARVPAFFALEGYFWYGYKSNFDKGKDFKRQYEEYGDAHWDLERFLLNHPCCYGLGDEGCESWEFYNETCGGADFFIFTPKEDDREEYYENIGKYNAFVYGWDDWNALQPEYWTPHRTYYWSLRGESDKYLLRSDQFIMALILNRVASMADTGLLVYLMSRGGNPEDGWSLRVKTYDLSPCLIISRRF